MTTALKANPGRRKRWNREDTAWPSAAAGRRRHPSPHRLLDPDHASVVADTRNAVVLEKSRSIQVHDIAQLSHDEGWRHGETRAHHVAHHHTEAEAARLADHGQAFGETAALIELDIDPVEPVGEARQIGEAEDTLIGDQRDR